MKNVYKEANKLYNQFLDERVICEIKNKELKINLREKIIYLFIIIPIIGVLPIGLFLISRGENLLPIIIPILFFTVLLLRKKEKIYFRDNEIIFAKRFKKEKIIYITKNPIIYVRHYEKKEWVRDYLGCATPVSITSYMLYIEDDENKISLDIPDIGLKKVMKIIDNLVLKEIK